jgi:hypothetical protein
MRAMPLKSLIGLVLHTRPFGRVDKTTGSISNFFADSGKLLLTITGLMNKLLQLVGSKEERLAMAGKWSWLTGNRRIKWIGAKLLLRKRSAQTRV